MKKEPISRIWTLIGVAAIVIGYGLLEHMDARTEALIAQQSEVARK